MSPADPVFAPTKDAHEAIRTAILHGRLRPGERLSPAAIGKEMGLSAGVVREALARLSSEYLVSAERNRGFRVSEITLEGLRHLSELRQLVEPETLAHSVTGGDLRWESEVVAAHYRLSNAPMPGDADDELGRDMFMVAHRHFHMTLLSASENTLMLQVCSSLWDAGEVYRRWSYARDSSVWSREHDELARLCLDRDADAAAELLKRHIAGTAEAVTTLLCGEDPA